MAEVRVMVVDDERVIREAFADLIEISEGMTVVAVAAEADEAIEAAARVRPDVALVDVRMPGGGAVATRGILDRSPHTRVLALSVSSGPDTVREMLQAGASGYLVKSVLPSEVIAGIRAVALGQTPLSAKVAGSVVDGYRSKLQDEDRERRRRHALRLQVASALDGNGMEMVYQPIYNLETHALVGVESLARFSMEPRRPPNEWFQAAADVGLATRLEVTAVIGAMAQRSQVPPDVFMTINLSPEALMYPGVLSLVPDGFADHLVVELTEHTPVLDYQALGDSFAPLRARGASLAIDDAGTGYASLRHLLELAPQFIKLDISIVQKIELDRAARALAVALTSFAGAIDAVVIAEGIETQSQLAAVRSLGIPLGQGFHLAKPGPIGQLTHGYSELAQAG